MKRWVKPVLFLLVAGVGAFAISQGWLDVLADQQQLSRYLNEHGVTGYLLIALAGGVYTALGAPRQLLAFICGFAMGVSLGTVFSTLATTLGAAACFYTARLLLRPTLTRRFGRRMAAFDRAVIDDPLLKIMLIRLLPVGSNLLTNLVGGASGIRAFPFLAGSALGYIPQMLVFALAGAGFGNANHYPVLLGAAGFVVASAIGAMLYRNRRVRNLSATVSDEF
ncbi:TVP38/TMEM64 family protein [Marinobacter koreensis]|uniref:TVP38/TMEM64 family membrane protein n=2 Tax=Marinobacter koreensis TaxID=335974 RepID=A0ABW0RNY8_9GAMM|nr:VTT domain-containing protein [Marinobacter koreensis]MCK7547964.1 VTT domain-containing protein [Marinobacter koreensis]